MNLLATDAHPTVARLLDSYDAPAILVSAQYQILATNDLYREKFGEPPADAHGGPHCYAVSHGYDRPCDQAGESCPLQAALASGNRERVLHVHQTPRGEEYVDVEMLPVFNDDGELDCFIELLRPLPNAGAHAPDYAMQGRSPAFQHMLGLITRVAREEVAVLLTGESGAGKELAAHAVHRNSARSRGHLVTLECAGLTESLFESELFGHVRGAFTGANHHKPGLVEAANGGTLFLDEIGDVPLSLQVKLLRLIESGTYRQVGSTEVRHADFRLVCATHKDLEQLVEQGLFRQDLYYRINVFPIRVPALRERLEDIPLLASSILAEVGRGRDYHLTESASRRLREHPYRGNIRELRNILARAVILSNTNILDRHAIELAIDTPGRFSAPQALSSDSAQPATAATDHEIRTLPTPALASGGAPATAAAATPDESLPALADAADDCSLAAAERRHLQALLERFGGDKQAAARAAGISVRSLYRKLASAGSA